MKIKNVFQLCALTVAMGLGVAACNEKKEEIPPTTPAEMPADPAHSGDATGGTPTDAAPPAEGGATTEGGGAGTTTGH